jgi:cytochrome P450
LILADDETHPWRRRMLRPAFSAKAMREQTEMLREHVVRLVRVLEASQEAVLVVDMVKMYNLTKRVPRIPGDVGAADH